MDHLVQGLAPGRLEVSAEGVGDRQQADLHDILGDPQQLGRLLLTAEMQRSQD